jgi:hypothetical protein
VRHGPVAAIREPLTAEQLDRLRASEIRFEHLQDASIDAEKAAKAALLRAR